MTVRIGNRRGTLALLLSAVAVSSVLAQGRGAPPPDTTSVRKTDSGYVFNFTNADLNSVLYAIAAAGGIGLITNRVPNQRISFVTQVPLPASVMIDYLRQQAASYSLKILGDSAGSRVVTIEGPQPTPPGPTAAQLAQQQLAAADLKVHVYQLKYQSATQLAPVLQSLFTGNGTPGGAAALPAGARGATPATGSGGSGAAVGATITRDVAVASGAAGGAASVTRMVTAGGGQSIEFTIAPGGQVVGAQGVGALSATSQLIRIVAEQTSNSLLVRATDADWALIQAILRGVSP